MPEIIHETGLMEADVVAITETHGDETSKQLPKMPGFKTFKTDRKIDNHWGGVAIYIKKEFRPYELEQKEHDEHLDEVKWVAISQNGENMALCVAYIKPGAPIASFRDTISRIQSKQSDLEEVGWKVVVMGDLNAHIGNGTGGIAGNSDRVDSRGKELQSWISNMQSILVNAHENCRGTWTWGRGDKLSVVDYIITSGDLEQDIEELLIDDDGNFDIGSDHNWMWLRLRCERMDKENVKKQPGWNINEETDWKSFREELEREAAAWSQPNTDNMTDTEAAEVLVEALNDMLMITGQRVVGLKQQREGRWGDGGMSRDVKTAIGRRKAACKAHKRAAKLHKPSAQVKAMDRQYSDLKQEAKDQKIKDKVKKAEKMLQAAQGDKSLNTLWNETRRLKKGLQGTSSPSLRDKQGNRLTTRGEIARELAQHADSLFNGGQTTQQHIETDYDQAQNSDEGDEDDNLTEPFTIEELDWAIKKLKRGKAIGADKIPNEFLKAAGPIFRLKLLAILNEILTLESIPEVWRQSRLCMLPKKGDLSLLDNYRGIAINSNIGKLFTKLLGARLEADVELKQLLGKIQHGFRRGFQCADALYILNRIMAEHGQRPGLAMAFLDIRKAYDKVNREKLWQKMEQLGYGGKLLRILKALYKDLTAVVTLDDVTSEPIRMSQGLKQGCVLSPLLFALYISDLGKQLEESGKGYQIHGVTIPGLFFADDMALVARSEGELQELLDMTGAFGRSMDIEFSGSKSVVIVAGRAVDPDKKWCIGRHQITEHVSYGLNLCDEDDDEYMYVEQEILVNIEEGPTMNETTEFKYLGQWVQVLKPRNEELAAKMAGRAEQLKGQVLKLARESFNFAYVARNLWEKVAMPALLYGSEVTELSEDDLIQVEKVQREVARRVTGGLNSTSIQGMYGELDWKDMYTRVAEKRLNYLHRLVHHGPHWWCNTIFNALGGIHSTDGWMTQVKTDLQYLQLDIDKVARLSREGWRSEVTKAVKSKRKTLYQAAIQSLPSLRFLKAKQEPKLEQYLDGSIGARLLFQARTGQMECTGSRFEKIGQTIDQCARTKPTQLTRPQCTFCGMREKDDVQHLLLECTFHEELRQDLWTNMEDDRDKIVQCTVIEQVQYLLGISKEGAVDLRAVRLFLKRAARDRENMKR